MKFFDLGLRPPLTDLGQTERIIKKSAELGYSTVGITCSNQRETGEIRDICKRCGLDLVTRGDSAPKTKKELLTHLRTLRKKFEVVAVRCFSKEVARQAAKDRRVDMISFPSTNPRKRFFDSAEAQLAKQSSKYLEIEMAPLLFLDSYHKSRLLASLRKEVLIARKNDVPLVLSSGADDPFLLRKPYDYAFLTYLFGLDFNAAKKAISENPKNVVDQNRKKASPDFVSPGVSVIKKGDDC